MSVAARAAYGSTTKSRPLLPVARLRQVYLEISPFGFHEISYSIRRE
jgi:hypothetical protein